MSDGSRPRLFPRAARSRLLRSSRRNRHVHSRPLKSGPRNGHVLPSSNYLANSRPLVSRTPKRTPAAKKRVTTNPTSHPSAPAAAPIPHRHRPSPPPAPAVLANATVSLVPVLASSWTVVGRDVDTLMVRSVLLNLRRRLLRALAEGRVLLSGSEGLLSHGAMMRCF